MPISSIRSINTILLLCFFVFVVVVRSNCWDHKNNDYGSVRYRYGTVLEYCKKSCTVNKNFTSNVLENFFVRTYVDIGCRSQVCSWYCIIQFFTCHQILIWYDTMYLRTFVRRVRITRVVLFDKNSPFDNFGTRMQ